MADRAFRIEAATGYSGRIARVNFADGVGHTDSVGAAAYFRRHRGYTVRDVAAAKAAEANAGPVETTRHEGGRTKDAAQPHDGTTDEQFALPESVVVQAGSLPGENVPTAAANLEREAATDDAVGSAAGESEQPVADAADRKPASRSRKAAK